ncbi:MAG: pimeloyl-ACP methyl ester esterase BioH [Proteobacteria bacterium]|jgi:pimeloyl-[acyl-carrier protein] methyl ester esterase|nr:pimeloyl-ACP methyl ester esterase BioH [Pseudomonadota bacterium]
MTRAIAVPVAAPVPADALAGAPGAPRVHVESVGAGAPLVLLHGFAMHGGLFAPIVPALAREMRVHVVDLPGHGWSGIVHPYDLDAIVDAVDAAVAAAAPRAIARAPLTVLGWSFGGQVAMHWAATRPARVAKLVLVATSPSFVVRDGWPWAMAPDTLARFGDELSVAWRLTLQRFLTLQVQGSDEGRRTLAQLRTRLFERGEPAAAALAATLDLLARTDLRSELPAVAAPATLVAGTRDALVPVGAMRALARALPQATLHEIAGAAHAPFLSHRQAFLDALGKIAPAASRADG